MYRSLQAAAAAFLITLTLAAFGLGMLTADLNTRALAFGDAPGYTGDLHLPEQPLEDLPLPPPLRVLLWLWEGERWAAEQLFS